MTMQTNHPLSQWIDQRMTDAEFAGKVGISKSHLSLILQGKRGLSLDLAVRIEEITKGEFPAARLLREQKTITDAAGVSG